MPHLVPVYNIQWFIQQAEDIHPLSTRGVSGVQTNYVMLTSKGLLNQLRIYTH